MFIPSLRSPLRGTFYDLLTTVKPLLTKLHYMKQTYGYYESFIWSELGVCT